MVSAVKAAGTSSSLGQISKWIYQFIVFPLLQMLVFIVGTAVILTIIAFILALLFPEPKPG